MKPTSCIGEANHGSTRWHIDAATLAVLEKVFSLDQFPNVETRKQLGTELGVSTRQIQVWFQNRRQRERKNKAASNSSLEIMPSKTTTPVSSTDDITTALFEFGTADKDENKSLGGLPLAPMPRMNSPTSSSGSSSPGRDAQLAKRSTAAARPAKDGAAALRPGEAELPPPIDEAPPLKRPEALLAGAGAGFAKPYLPGATASISSWTPPTLPTSGGPAANPLRGLGAPSLADTAPNVASKLAEACQSSLIGRTLQDYGGIVQVITEPRAPFNVLSVSSGWERLSGFTRDEVVGRPLKVLQGPQTEPEIVSVLMRGVHEQRPVSVRLTNYTKQGQSFVHQLSSEPLRDVAGKVQCFQATSLVLRRPGEGEATEELASSRLPLIFNDRVPPLWPLLSRAATSFGAFTPAPVHALPTSYAASLSALRPPVASLAAMLAEAPPPLREFGAASKGGSRGGGLPKVPSLSKLPTEADLDMLGWLGGSATDLELVGELNDDIARDVETAFLERTVSSENLPSLGPCPMTTA